MLVADAVVVAAVEKVVVVVVDFSENDVTLGIIMARWMDFHQARTVA
jgi:hypothetical protein